MRSFILFLLMFVTVGALAQTVQSGIVKEYNEKAQKTPLGGVELNVRSANSTVSDKDGSFTLSFLTLKPGERINVRRIEKLGYEIFNKEAIEQWNLNPNVPFVIVMCRSDRFKAVCNNYYSKASVNYKRQFDKETASVKKLKEEGKIKEEEYKRKLIELQEDYDRQLDNLDNYVDRFARIDLSQLKKEELDIIDLVDQGRFDEAITKYEELELEQRITTAVRSRDVKLEAVKILSNSAEEDQKNIEALYESLTRNIDALLLAGGYENHKKIEKIYKTVAAIDTLNHEWQLKTAHYFVNQELYEQALDFFSRAAKADDIRSKLVAEYGRSCSLSGLKRFDEAFAIDREFLPMAVNSEMTSLIELWISKALFDALYSSSVQDYQSFKESVVELIEQMSEADVDKSDALCKSYMVLAYLEEKINPRSENISGYFDLSIGYAHKIPTDNEDKEDLIQTLRLNKTHYEFNYKNMSDRILELWEYFEGKYGNNPQKYGDKYITATELKLQYLFDKNDNQFSDCLMSYLKDIKIRKSGIGRAINTLACLNRIEMTLENKQTYLEMQNLFQNELAGAEMTDMEKDIVATTYSQFAGKLETIDPSNENIARFFGVATTMFDNLLEEKLFNYEHITYLVHGYMNSARNHITSGDYQEVDSICQRAMNVIGSDSNESRSSVHKMWLWFGLSDGYRIAGKKHDEINYLRKVTEFSANDQLESQYNLMYRNIKAMAYTNLSWYEYEKGNYQEGLTLANKGLTYDSQKVEMLDTKGACLFKMGEMEEADHICGQIKKMVPPNHLSRMELFKLQSDK